MDQQIIEERIEHDLEQGSPEWDAFRLDHDGASEAAAMLGLSKTVSRNELLHAKSTGIPKEFARFVEERIFQNGHRVEALARPIVARQIGKSLSPAVFSRGRMSASVDGIAPDDADLWEHKQWNETLAAAVLENKLPDEFMAQPQQQLMVTGAKKCIYTVSEGTEGRMVRMEILPDPAWFERIRAGWAQFHKDREEYTRKLAAGEIEPPKEMPKAEAMVAMPTLFIQAKGEITEESAQNLVKFSAKTAEYLADRKADLLHLRTSPDVTDQDVANAKARGADCREAVKRLALVQDGVLAQTLTLGQAMAEMDKLKEDYRLVALELEKEADKAIDAKKLAILNKARLAYTEHVAALEIETKPMRLTVAPPDFAGAMNKKRTSKGWQDAVDTALANGKIAADAQAKDFRAKLSWCKENAAGQSALFPDLQALMAKPMEDFTLTITSRIEKQKADEAAKLEAERIRMEAEAKAKAEREAAAKLAEEEARIRAEERAKVEGERKAREAAEVEIARAKAEQEAILAAERAKREAQAATMSHLPLDEHPVPAAPADGNKTIKQAQEDCIAFMLKYKGVPELVFVLDEMGVFLAATKEAA